MSNTGRSKTGFWKVDEPGFHGGVSEVPIGHIYFDKDDWDSLTKAQQKLALDLATVVHNNVLREENEW